MNSNLFQTIVTAISLHKTNTLIYTCLESEVDNLMNYFEKNKQDRVRNVEHRRYFENLTKINEVIIHYNPYPLNFRC